MLTGEYKRELFTESNGHPYVMKVLLGEIAKAGRIHKVERLVATMEDILDALFERTYATLSPVAKRVFLTLCSWRSAIPLLSLEAVLLRPNNEKMDVKTAVDELGRSSFIEISTSAQDGQHFLTVPLAAAVFGKRKLTTSPMKSAIEADLQLLHAFGAAQQSEIKWGVTPRIEKLFRYLAYRISQGKDTIENHESMLEFIARNFPPAWLLLAKLHQELLSAQDLDKAKECIRRYLEATSRVYTDQERAWRELGSLCQQTKDWVGEIHALVGMCELPDVPFRTISSAANRINSLLSDYHLVLDSEEKRIVSQRLAQLMESRITEGDATDCSRLAWLFMRLRNEEKARQIANLGLSMESENEYCKNLLLRFPGQRF